MSIGRSSLLLLAFAFAAPAFAGGYDDEEAFAFDDEEDLSGLDLDRGDVKAGDKKKAKEAPPPVDLAEEDEPLEDFDFGDEDEPDLGDFEGEDEPLEDFDRPAAKTATLSTSKLPGPITHDVAGKEPLADNYALTVVAVDRDAVVVELPVLIARSRVGVEKGFLVIGEVYVGTTKVAEVRQTVEPASLAEFGPSFAYLKVLAPVVEKQGEIKLVVKKANADGSGATELFTRVTPYTLR